jgi:hypothetical protein
MIHFAILHPDWNSLDSVRLAHSALEVAALIFFALLVVSEALAHLSDNDKKEKMFDKIGIVFFAIAVLAEIIAYPYGQRSDALSGQVIVSLDAAAREGAHNASRALNDSEAGLTQSRAAESAAGKATEIAHAARIEADSFERDIVFAKNQAADAQSRLADATARTARLEQQLSWRTVTPEQKAKLRALLLSSNLLMPLNELTINISYSNQNSEAEEYAGELKDALNGFGAEVSEPGGVEFFGTKVLQGVIVTANPVRNTKAIFLLNALHGAGIGVSGERNDKMDAHAIEIFVGPKPRP